MLIRKGIGTLVSLIGFYQGLMICFGQVLPKIQSFTLPPKDLYKRVAISVINTKFIADNQNRSTTSPIKGRRKMKQAEWRSKAMIQIRSDIHYREIPECRGFVEINDINTSEEETARNFLNTVHCLPNGGGD